MNFLDKNKKTLNLFPLDKVIVHLSGYYMDSNFNVFSTKKTATPQLLLGSFYGGATTYMMAKRTYVSSTLKNMALRHKDFKSDTKLTINPQTVINSVISKMAIIKDRDHASSIKDGIDKKGWIIVKVDVVEHAGPFMDFSKSPTIHLTEASYKSELERLATSYPGVQFVSLKIGTSVVSGGLKWS